MFRWFFGKSKWIHKWVGLLLMLYCMWMASSGILLNHPGLISSISIPASLIPPQYRVHDWNRGTLKCAVFSTINPSIGFTAGTLGVFVTEDGGASFRLLDRDFPTDQAHRATAALHLTELSSGMPAGAVSGDSGGQYGSDRLFAATVGGLYVLEDPLDPDAQWTHIPLPSPADEMGEGCIAFVEASANQLIIFTNSNAYQIDPVAEEISAERMTIHRMDEAVSHTSDGEQISLVQPFFELHSGSIFGLAGRLLFDLVGLIVIFLSITAFYLWYFPGAARRTKRRCACVGQSSESDSVESKTQTGAASTKAQLTKKRFVFAFFFKYHLKLGIWVSPILIIMAGTGFFLRPPTLILLTLVTVPSWVLPGHTSSENKWHNRIFNVMYHAQDHTITLESSDGYWHGVADLSEPLELIELHLPIHVMGANVLQNDPERGYIVGSFCGLFRVDQDTGSIADLVTGEVDPAISVMRSSEHMASGYFVTPDGDAYVTLYHQGIRPIVDTASHDSAEVAGLTHFAMPVEIAADYRMPLWDFMFELHNGRVFRDWIGNWYLLVPPLGSALFMLIALTGIYDWLFLKLSKIRHSRRLRD